MLTREQLYQTALFEGFLVPLLAPGATVGGPTPSQTPGTPTVDQPFNVVSRETSEVHRVPPLLQPVLFMDEAVEEYGDSGAGLVLTKATVYFHVGCTSAPGTPVGTIINPIIDTLVHAFDISRAFDYQQLGLGDVIQYAQFKGMSIKNYGQNSTDPAYRQAAAYIPFEIVFA